LLLCRLEAEIKDAQLKAKEEMMQGIQIAKEMAQQELSSQKAVYERKIQALEAELVRALPIFSRRASQTSGELSSSLPEGAWLV
jgi:hypothetical protein